jgi:hypothetical protein
MRLTCGTTCLHRSHFEGTFVNGTPLRLPFGERQATQALKIEGTAEASLKF